MKRLLSFAAICLATLLAACSSMDLSGIGGDNKFSCAAPEGVPCMSVTGINANVDHGTLPSLRRTPAQEAALLDPKRTELPTLAGDGGPATPMTAEPAATPAKPRSYADGTTSRVAMVSPADMLTPYSGQPIRTAPKILRLWLAPYKDRQSDLHDQRYVYLTVNTGDWLIEANQANIARQYKPVFKLGKKNASTSEEEGAAPGSVVGPATSEVPRQGMQPTRIPGLNTQSTPGDE